MKKTETLPQRLGKRLPWSLFFLLFALWVTYSYFFLHEAGHAIAVVLFGGKITEFQVGLWNSHYIFSGQLSNLLNSLRACAGILFPMVVWAVLMLALPKKISPFVGFIRLVISSGFLASLLPILVKPILYQQGWRGQDRWGDDVVQFLDYSRWNGIGTAAIVLLILAVGLALFQYKAQVGATIAQMRREKDFRVNPRIILAIALVWGIQIGSTMIINRGGLP